MQNTQNPKLKARVSSEWTEDYISVLQKRGYDQQLQSHHAPWVAVTIPFNLAIMYSGQRLFPTYLQGTLKLKGHPDGFWNRPWWLASVLQALVVSQCSTCSTEWSEIVRGPRSPGKFPCHSSHGFPSSVSPVSKLDWSWKQSLSLLIRD